jgi:hypothetical protein
MDRGVIVGGGLITASFLVAILLNRSAHEETPRMEAVPPPPAHVCEQAAQRVPVAKPVREDGPDECKPLPGDSVER